MGDLWTCLQSCQVCSLVLCPSCLPLHTCTLGPGPGGALAKRPPPTPGPLRQCLEAAKPLPSTRSGAAGPRKVRCPGCEKVWTIYSSEDKDGHVPHSWCGPCGIDLWPPAGAPQVPSHSLVDPWSDTDDPPEAGPRDAWRGEDPWFQEAEGRDPWQGRGWAARAPDPKDGWNSWSAAGGDTGASSSDIAPPARSPAAEPGPPRGGPKVSPPPVAPWASKLPPGWKEYVDKASGRHY